MMRAAAVLGLFLPLLLRAGNGAVAALAERILAAGLDTSECYRVRNLHFTREDIRIYLNDGYLVFAKPVDGAPMAAVFSGDVEAGEGEVLLFPPLRSERLSLASYTHQPNLDEHFRAGLFIFTDDTYAELSKLVHRREGVEKSPERGVLFAEQWEPVLRNFYTSFQLRLVADILSENRGRKGFFYAALNGRTLGNFDVVYDPRSREQIMAGQVVFRQNRSYFDIWTRFAARSFRQRTRQVDSTDYTIGNYRIQATLEPDLRLSVVTRAAVVPGPETRRVLAFDISPQMRVSAVTVDGAPAEVLQPQSMRSTLIRGDANSSFLVVPSEPLAPGREYELEFHHEGAVVSDAGNGVYFVGARGSWYPNRADQFARFDLTFRYPKDLDLVATGKAIEDRTEGEWRIAHHRTDVPVRLAGFNLGRYERQAVTHDGYTIEVCANRTVETALEKPQQVLIVPHRAQTGPRQWTVDLNPFSTNAPLVKPGARLHELALEIAGEVEFLRAHFGPPVLNALTISPIPGTFGQGFPGLIYLSTLSYLEPKDRPPGARSESENLFFNEVLHAHETAHQWWGNVVTSASDEDNWIMEALANYSALLYLETRQGKRALDAELADYRTRLLARTESGQTIDSAGPIVWGTRLLNSQAPSAWRTITYDKGSWIIHMLRRRMGDERFLAMLGQLRKRFQYRAITTDQFRQFAAESLPPNAPDPQLENFFEQWVYETGIPALKLQYSVKGKAPEVRVVGTVTQSDVDEDFSTLVPVEIQLARAKPQVVWVRTVNGTASFSVRLRQAPARVLLDPDNSVLRK